MTISTLPLSYCTNVHAGLSVAAVERGLTDYTVPLARSVDRLAAGLWLAQPVIAELQQSADSLAALRATLSGNDIECYTLNAFPYGNFHDERVKQNVYLPDWSSPARLEYTLGCADILASLLPAETAGSISTVPLAFKNLPQAADFREASIAALLQTAESLRELEAERGSCIRLAIEPEPLCLLETTPEVLEFFDELFGVASRRGVEETARRHLGVCYDVCHQAVEFESVADSIAQLDRAGIRLNKIHITCALELRDPMQDEAGREALAAFVEPRYLHQTIARGSDGRIHRLEDLTAQFTRTPPTEFAESDCWRVHYHVPVNAEHVGPLGTTRPVLREALAAVARLDYAPHLEIETYTWGVLPGDERPPLVEGLTSEVQATRQLLSELDEPPGGGR